MTAPGAHPRARVTAIVVVYLAVLALAAWMLAVEFGADALATGQALYPHRAAIQLLIPQPGIPAPDLLWLGDSTLMNVKGIASYPSLLRGQLKRAGVRSGGFGLAGLDFFAYYLLAGPALDLHPKLLVIVANLRIFGPHGGPRGFGDLAAELPSEELPRALLLPLGARDLTIPRFLLARLLGTEWGERTFLVAEGLRSSFQQASTWIVLGQKDSPQFHRFRFVVERTSRAYDEPLSSTHPLVRFAGATVRMATDRGVRTLVVVSPIPWEWLEKLGRYDRARYERRIDALRATVEANGGRLIDLHRALGDKEFRDFSGHFNAAGAVHMGLLVMPAIWDALGLNHAPAGPAAK
jgi:hypothetical protein